MDLEELVSRTPSAVLAEGDVSSDDETFWSDDQDIEAWKRTGYIDTRKLLEEHKIELNDTPFSQ